MVGFIPGTTQAAQPFCKAEDDLAGPLHLHGKCSPGACWCFHIWPWCNGPQAVILLRDTQKKFYLAFKLFLPRSPLHQEGAPSMSWMCHQQHLSPCPAQPWILGCAPASSCPTWAPGLVQRQHQTLPTSESTSLGTAVAKIKHKIVMKTRALKGLGCKKAKHFFTRIPSSQPQCNYTLNTSH